MMKVMMANMVRNEIDTKVAMMRTMMTMMTMMTMRKVPLVLLLLRVRERNVFQRSHQIYGHLYSLKLFPSI
jgi:hypothetical protein